MNLHKLLSLILLFLAFTSCNKWIDVKPTDRLAESILFENKEGFLKSLNGVYIEMSNPVLYGQAMTAGTLDAMGQYYVSTSTLHPYFYYMTFNFTQAVTKSGFESIWQKTYTTIANLNVLLENCPNAPSATLPAPYFGIVKGEALALRAFLHFDMLRLFGPSWSASTKDQPAIPYYTDASRQIKPLSSSEEVIALILADLEHAQELLKDADPIITSGVNNVLNPDGSNVFNLRQYRLNYYAVRALLARVYLWSDNREKAGETARQIIAEVQQSGEEIFPFVTMAAATNASDPDRLFSSEVMFGVYTVNRTTMYNTLFSPAQEVGARLAPNPGNTVMTRVDAMYDDKNDYRYKIWENVSLTGIPLTTNQKFKDYVNSTSRYMIPLIRISELYLMAAECSNSVTEASNYVNTIRSKRNSFNLTLTDQGAIDRSLTSEFRREFIGEGQQFFYYKRKRFTEVPNHAAQTGNKVVVVDQYRVPLPDSETSLRNSIQ